MLRRFALGLLCCLVPPAAYADPLYLQDFEKGADGWSTTDLENPFLLFDDPTAPSPARVQLADVAGGGENWVSPFIAVNPGSTLCVSMWVDWHSGGWPMVGMVTVESTWQPALQQWLFGWPGMSNNQGKTAEPINIVNGWQKVTTEVTLPADAIFVRFSNGLSAEKWRDPARPHLAYFDQFLVREGSCAEVGNTCPVVSAGPPQVLECQGGVASTTVTGQASDADGDLLATYWTSGHTQASFQAVFGLGTHPLSFIVSDSICPVSAETAVTVADTLPPSIKCPANLAAECVSGGSNQQPGAAQASDLCDSTAPVLNDGLPWYALGTTAVTFTAYDKVGHTASCKSLVVVSDTISPTVTCPSPVKLECGSPGQGTAKALDACDQAPKVWRLGPAVYPLGMTTDLFAAVDDSGNTGTCNALVTTVDTKNPVLTCPAATTLECGKPATVQAKATDACDPAPVIARSGQVPTLPGTGQVSFTATDASGHVAMCTTQVSVVDSQAPVVTCAPPVTVECGQTASVPAKVTDLCDAAPTVAQTGQVPKQPGAGVMTTTAKDAAGNTATCGTTVTVVDSKSPLVTCPAALKVECGQSVAFPASAADACDPAPVLAKSGQPATKPGTTTWIAKATDASGNAGQCATLVTTVDTQAPSLTCPPATTMECGQPIALSAKSTDICDPSPVVVQAGTAPVQPGKGDILFTATDASGLKTSCKTQVSVVDTQAPLVTCPASATVECGQSVSVPTKATDICDATLIINKTMKMPAQTGPGTATTTATDDSGHTVACTTAISVVDTQAPVITCPAALTVECGKSVSVPVQAGDVCDPSPSVAKSGQPATQPGTATWSATATDASGLAATCQTLVTTVDTQKPVITCPSAVTLECGQPLSVSAQASDACDAAPSMTKTTQLPALTGKGQVTFTATDASGLSTVCQTAVNVVDTKPPVIQCPPPATVACDKPAPKLVATAKDTCSEPVAVKSDAPAKFAPGKTVVHFTGTDAAGNKAMCTTDVQAEPTQPPKVIVGGVPPMLWSPQHKMETIGLEDCNIKVIDSCGQLVPLDKTKAKITCVTSDEENNSCGDGNTGSDIKLVDATHVQVRRERQGTGDGRVYSIGFQVQDAAGNITLATCTATVPHDMNKPAKDSGVKVKVCK